MFFYLYGHTQSSRTLIPGVATAAWTVVAPTLRASNTLAPGVATAAWTAIAPTVVPGTSTLIPGVATASWTVIPPSVNYTITLSPGVASASWSVVPPTVRTVQRLVPAVVTAAWSVVPPTLRFNKRLYPSIAAASWLVISPTISRGDFTPVFQPDGCEVEAISPIDPIPSIERCYLEPPGDPIFDCPTVPPFFGGPLGPQGACPFPRMSGQVLIEAPPSGRFVRPNLELCAMVLRLSLPQLPQGLPGPQGPQGSRVGDPGPQGFRGTRGITGVVGELGPPGFPGARGATGGQGPRGDAGPCPQILSYTPGLVITREEPCSFNFDTSGLCEAGPQGPTGPWGRPGRETTTSEWNNLFADCQLWTWNGSAWSSQWAGENSDQDTPSFTPDDPMTILICDSCG